MAGLPSPTDGCLVVMGVSGSGKSTIGRALAARLGLTFLDADDLHPPGNIAKMRRGEPLNDSDRAPWLDQVGARLHPGTIIACSALRRSHRDRLRQAAGAPLVFLYLCGSEALLADRLRGREGHFMPASLLPSQLATLEEPDGEEGAVVVDITRAVPDLVEELLARIAAPGTEAR
jgi:gluconokinase